MNRSGKCVVAVGTGFGLWMMLGGMLTNAADDKTCSAPGDCDDGYNPYKLYKRCESESE